MFAVFDSKDVSALAAFMTDDVRLRLGNAEPVQGKSAFVEAVNVFLASVAGFRHQVLNVWSDGDALIAEFDVHYTRLDGGEVTLPMLQRVPAPGRLGCGVPQLHRRHARVLLAPL
jgi:ketosteroid isomerase-like protein